MTKRGHILIQGRVQGVGFRAATERMALASNLRGFVRNLDSGDVEIVAEGEPADLRRLAEWARRGPPAARVDGVQFAYSEATGEFSGFRAE
jgi:acylphosphatase